MSAGTPPIRTATMAKIYAGQGHYDLAAEIYRHLLRENPDRREWADALGTIETKLAAQARGRARERLAELIAVMLSCRRLMDLQQMKRHVAQRQEVGNDG
ncbi:MAG: hypothetical protein WAK95_05390 [Desulfobacterales bacterium]